MPARDDPDVLRLPSRLPTARTLPDPLTQPERAAAAVVSDLRWSAALSREEWAARIRQTPGMDWVNAALVEQWEAGNCMATGDVLVVMVGLAGRASLAVLGALLP